MPDTEWVDTREQADAVRAERRRRRLKLLLPIFYLLILVAVVLGIGRYTYVRNREDAVALSENLVKVLEQRITSQVEIHLLAATRVVNFASWIYQTQKWRGEAVDMFEIIGLKALEVYPQIQSFQVGIPNGGFLMTRRMPDGSIDTKLIRIEGNRRDVRWIRRDPGGKVIGIETDPKDTYDPRNRPWYEGAVKTRSVYWTDVYIFFTDRKPGVTAALAVRSAKNELLGVLSVDIGLDGLSRFLADLHIGKTGKALIIDDQGHLVAFPVLERMLKKTDGVPTPVMVDELGEPALTRAFDRFRTEGYGIRRLIVGDRRYSSMAVSLENLVGRKWTVLITVPEDDFVGFLRENVRRNLILSLVPFAMVAFMVGLLLRRSIQSERAAMLLADRKRMMAAQSRAFAELTSMASLYEAGQAESLETASVTVSRSMNIRRVSLWRTIGDGERLLCLDSYDSEYDGHTRGAELVRQDFPQLFESTLGGEEISAADAETDPRTQEIFQSYLKPLGCCSLLAVPVRLGSRVVGGVWFEHDGKARGWTAEDLNLARFIAGILAVRIGSEGRPAGGETPGTDATATGLPPEAPSFTGAPCVSGSLDQPLPHPKKLRTTSLKAVSAGGPGIDREHLCSAVTEGVSVLVLRFTDPIFLASPRSGDAPPCLFEDLIRQIEEMAEANGVEYLKVMGEEVVFATGLAGEGTRRGQKIADVALAVQEVLMTICADRNVPLGFRLGIESGRVFGSLLGCDQGVFNLWGDASRLATQMAEAGIDGGIQVAQAAYECLRDEYVFKLRGGFYVEGRGEIRTYLLQGKL